MTAGKLTAFLLTIKPPSPPPVLRRRTLRPPPLPSAHLRRTSPIFSSPQSLSNFLSPGTKTLTNLFIEISSGETSLLLSPSHAPLRAINVITVKIRNPHNRQLVESRQLLSNGDSGRSGFFVLWRKSSGFVRVL